MKLSEIVVSSRPPRPWEEGENIPWNEPGFSERMLHEHLSQAHDGASRRTETIDRHVAWIHGELLGGCPSRVLDLGCGPGLYANRLAAQGHACVGIDFSPASVRYAQSTTAGAEFVLGDVRETPFGEGYDLVMFLYGELNVFRRAEAEAILRRCRAALKPGGTLLLEPQTYGDVKAQAGRSWYASAHGLFSEQPHLCLKEAFWDEASATTTVRHWVVDAATGETNRWASTYAAYTDAGYAELLSRCGFAEPRFCSGLGGVNQEGFFGLVAITGR
jgi:SAM-dependent methyltransferase